MCFSPSHFLPPTLIYVLSSVSFKMFSPDGKLPFTNTLLFSFSGSLNSNFWNAIKGIHSTCNDFNFWYTSSTSLHLVVSCFSNIIVRFWYLSFSCSHWHYLMACLLCSELLHDDSFSCSFFLKLALSRNNLKYSYSFYSPGKGNGSCVKQIQCTTITSGDNLWFPTSIKIQIDLKL